MIASVQVACLQPLEEDEMGLVRGGELLASIWESLLVSFIINIDDAVHGFSDGWSAYRP